MYQDTVGGAGGMEEEGEAAEYHIMYGHYDSLAAPTPQATTATLKLGRGGAKDGALAGVALAEGGTLVPAAELVEVPGLAASPPCGTDRDGTLAVTTEGLGVAGPGHDSPVGVGGMEAAAAALVTSMVAPGECEGGIGGRKVIVKLFNSNTFSLDIIADGDGEAAVAPHHMLGRGGTTLVHAKLANGTIIPTQGQGEIGGGTEEELATPPAHTPHQATQEAALPCRVMWTCAYCSVMLATSEAMAAHQQECAKALGDLPPLDTNTSQATVDALMSPLHQQEEPAYHLKLEATTQGPETTTTDTPDPHEGSSTPEVVTVWVCAVCDEDFPHPRALGRHLSSHSVQQLATALLQLATPRQRVRPVATTTTPDTPTITITTTTTTTTAASTTAITTATTTPTTTTTANPPSPDPLYVDCPVWPGEHPAIKMEEESVDNPGDTPPQTPPQDKPPARRARRRPGPKPQDRPERKRKCTRRKKEEEEEEEAVVGGNKTETHSKVYRTTTTTTTMAITSTTTTTTTQGAPSHPNTTTTSTSSSTGKGSRDPHHCEVCNKKLSSRGNLAKHLIRHRAKKPFECSLCHATFNAKRDCRNHYLQHHTSERPNRCHICGKSYVDKSYLLAHLVFHRDQKAYSCELCGKKFNTSRCVTRHKKRHQEEKRFICDICFRPFAVKGDLTSHKRKVHSKHTTRTQQQQQQQQQQLVSSQLPLQTQQPQPQEVQGKAKELPDFILPDVVTSPHILPDQLLPSDLSAGGSLGGAVTSKGGIFISGDPLAVSSLIAGGEGDNTGGCSYGVTLAPSGGGGPGRDVVGGEGQPAYIMINSSSAEKGVATTTAGLSIVYTSSPTLTQQVGDLDDIQQLSTSVGPGLVGGEGQLDLESHLEGQHHPQDHGTAGLTTGDTGLATTHRGDLGLGDGAGGPGGVLVGGEDTHNPPSAHDNSGFPLELISQTYQLDLQRSQPATPYLG